MSDLNPPTETPSSEPNDSATPPQFSIWRDMWLRPRAVLRQELARPGHWQQWAPAILAGIAAVLETFMLMTATPVNTGNAQTAAITGQSLLLTAMLLGPLFGMLHVGLMGFLLRHVGHLFGGRCQPDAMRRGISLALVPLAWSLSLVLFELWWIEQHGKDAWVMISTGLRALLNLWTLLLLAMSISEVQQLPLRRAAGTLASTFLLLMLVLLLLQPR